MAKPGDKPARRASRVGGHDETGAKMTKPGAPRTAGKFTKARKGY